MLAALINTIFFLITSISNIITKVILSTTAEFIVLIIQLLKLSGEASKGILEQAADAIRSVLEYVFELIIEVISAIISAILSAIKDVIIESIVSGSSAVGEIVEQTKSSLEGLLSDVPEIIQGFAEMITTLISDFLSNCMEAIGRVQETAA